MNGLPFGVMLIGPAHSDERLARIAGLLQPETRLAVVGAHLTGQPLNPQLLSLGARLDRTTTTAPVYRLHALRTTPPKPGLEHVGEGGAQIEVEIWRLPAAGLGRLLATLPAPWRSAACNWPTAPVYPASSASRPPSWTPRTSRRTKAGGPI